MGVSARVVFRGRGGRGCGDDETARGHGIGDGKAKEEVQEGVDSKSPAAAEGREEGAQERGENQTTGAGAREDLLFVVSDGVK